jgi:hypothetical protein
VGKEKEKTPPTSTLDFFLFFFLKVESGRILEFLLGK